MPLGRQLGPDANGPCRQRSSRASPRIERASRLQDLDRNSDARGFQAHRSATVTRPLMVHRDVEGVDDIMGATIVLRRHSAAEIALKNFEIRMLVPFLI
jgi:hypothetical protein